MIMMIMMMTMMTMMVMITCVRPTQVVSRHECRQSRPEISIRRLFYDNGDDDSIGEIFLSDWSEKHPFADDRIIFC